MFGGIFERFGKYLHFLTLFVIPGSPEIASESISYGISQQKQQKESKMDAGEPKPSRGIDLSPPHVAWIFSDSIGIHPFLKWEYFPKPSLESLRIRLQKAQI